MTQDVENQAIVLIDVDLWQIIGGHEYDDYVFIVQEIAKGYGIEVEV